MCSTVNVNDNRFSFWAASVDIVFVSILTSFVPMAEISELCGGVPALSDEEAYSTPPY